MKRFCIGLLFFAFLSSIPAMACTNFIVGKNASTDGSTIVSYAADSYVLYGFLHHSPAADYPQGAMRVVNDWDTGRPLGEIRKLSNISGYTEISKVHIEGDLFSQATEEEINMLYNEIFSGIIL